MYRHLLCLGLLLGVVKISGMGLLHCVRSLCGTIYNTVYCSQYNVHGHGSSQYEYRIGKSFKKWKLRKFFLNHNNFEKKNQAEEHKFCFY